MRQQQHAAVKPSAAAQIYRCFIVKDQSVAEALKNQYGPDIPQRIGAMIQRVAPSFDAEHFVASALHGYAELDLLARGRHIADALRQHLPQDYPQAIEWLLASLGEKIEQIEGQGMAPFLYLPHVLFVAHYGLDHFEASMRAQYELTQRFSAEFSIRFFIERHPQATLARLQQWASDPSPHVRRLVSEGTRPRLPWAQRLRDFQRDPAPVLALLELLKDDPSLYVRRSVANNLNDIGKDHPAVLSDTAQRWLQGASAERQWLVRHALRSAVKRGETGALQVLGFGAQAQVGLNRVQIAPATPQIGQRLSIQLQLHNPGAAPQALMADLRIHFIKANGSASPKVFKLKALTLAPGAHQTLQKTISLAEMTTRKHYPGTHQVELLLNGQPLPLGHFELMG